MPLFVQLPDTFNVPLGAVNVPLLKVIVVVLTVPLDPVKLPPLIVRPPLKFCVWVLASYVTLVGIVNKLVTVSCLPFASKVPFDNVNVLTLKLLPVNCNVPPLPL